MTYIFMYHKHTAQKVFTNRIHPCNQHPDQGSLHDQHLRSIPWSPFQLLNPLWGDSQNTDSHMPLELLSHCLRIEPGIMYFKRLSRWPWFSAGLGNSWSRSSSISHLVTTSYNGSASVRVLDVRCDRLRLSGSSFFQPLFPLQQFLFLGIWGL